MQVVVEYEGDASMADDVAAAVESAVRDTDVSAYCVFSDVSVEELEDA